MHASPFFKIHFIVSTLRSVGRSLAGRARKRIIRIYKIDKIKATAIVKKRHQERTRAKEKQKIEKRERGKREWKGIHAERKS